MIDTINRPPLWRVMCRAMAEVEMGARATVICAAEIRAIAGWIERRQVEDYLATVPRLLQTDVPKVIGWLTAEADLAERGEVEA